MRIKKKKDIDKSLLYESVKELVETPHPHLHLPQHKLFTLFSISLQYFLYASTKNEGHYVIRIEDGSLADKLSRRAKDESTRNFMQKIILTRKQKFLQSTFYIDYFHPTSWNLVNDLPRERLRGALIVKNTTPQLLQENSPLLDSLQDHPLITEFMPLPQMRPNSPTLHAEIFTDGPVVTALKNSTDPHFYFYQSLQQVMPKTIIIAFDSHIPQTQKVEFSFIKAEEEKRTLQGVKLSPDLLFDYADED